jgi:hypothetical protein
MSVGTLYYVDSAVRDFYAICDADEADLATAVRRSRAISVKDDALRNGRFATNVKVDLGPRINGDIAHEYKQTVQYSLSDVFIEHIALDRNGEIFQKLMNKPSCDRAVMTVIHAGGYVCQGHKMLEATAEFKLDLQTEGGIGTTANAAADIKEAVKLAVETQSSQRVVERQGRLLAGSALKYGVAMNPTCMAPPTGYFKRVLPQSMLGRLKNFILFRIIEPMLPVDEERSAATSATSVQGG